MRLLELADTLPEETESVVAVGNFDGVHLGHKHLIGLVVQRAKERGAASVIVTFEPHPKLVLNPGTDFEVLSTFEEKVRLLESSGTDYLLCIPFNSDFSRESPEDFIKKVMVKKLHTVEWVMGENHGIGKNREGQKIFLHNLLCKYHINPFIANPLELSKTVVSSTRIRENIINGRIGEAVEMLGHPYVISTELIPGWKVGSKLGFPTLNFKRPPFKKVMPPQGVYAAELDFRGCIQRGALYFGKCPTFTDRSVHFEFHSLEGDGPFPEAGEVANLLLHGFVRKDRSFPDTEKLRAQISRDIETVRTFFLKEKVNAINQGT